MEMTATVPENCTHSCSTCGEACSNQEGFFSQFERTLEVFSSVDSDELLAALHHIANS